VNAALLGHLLTGIATLLPLIPGGGAVSPILAILGQVVPVVVQEAQDLAPIVKNIIAALKNDPTATADELATLDALDAQVDAAFEAAAAAAQAEDA
jgi:hypothetical protein